MSGERRQEAIRAVKRSRCRVNIYYVFTEELVEVILNLCTTQYIARNNHNIHEPEEINLLPTPLHFSFFFVFKKNPTKQESNWERYD